MKKGFTLVELLAVIIVLAIVLGIAIAAVTGAIGSGQNGVYKNYETTLKSAARNYLIECLEGNIQNSSGGTCKIPSVGGSIVLKHQELANLDFIDNLTDPKGGTCNQSYVKVTRKSDVSTNLNFEYQACLVCDNKKDTCS